MIDNDIIRPLVALGFGFCFGASYYFLTYYKNGYLNTKVPEIPEKVDGSCCANEKPTSCADTGSCCQTKSTKTTSGCGTGSCCTTGSSSDGNKGVAISKKVERFGYNKFCVKKKLSC